MSSCFSFWDTPFDMWIWFSCGHGRLGLHTWWWMIWCHLIFQPTTHLMLYWGIFPFWLRFVDLHWFAWSSLFKRYMSSCGWFFFYDDSLEEPFLSHLVRLILSNIVVILWWSYLRRIDSHIIISVKYMLDLLYIPIELFSSHQDRPDVLVAIQSCYHFLYSAEGYLFLLLVTISMIYAEMSL